MPKLLTDAEITRFAVQGYLSPVPVLSDAEARACRDRLETLERRSGPLRGMSRSKLHLTQAWLDALVRHPRLLDAIEDLLGPDLLCWSSTLFIKEANDPSFVSWHQDATYWGLSSPDVVTAWIALSPATRQSGCMKFVPGSHTGVVRHRETYARDNLLSRGQEIAVDVDENRASYVPLMPGEASLHHVLLFHASEANTSADRRIGFAIRYLPTFVRQTSSHRDSAVLVRGVDRFGHFDLESPPRSDDDPAAVERLARATAQSEKILLDGAEAGSARAGANDRR